MKRSRKAIREAVLSCLYELEISPVTPEQALEDLFEMEDYAPKAKVAIEEIVAGIVKNVQNLNDVIHDFLPRGWSLGRLTVIDFNILRIACYEFFLMDNIPPKVTISEALALIRKFGDDKSCSFIHGMLSNILEESPKVNWDPVNQTVIKDEKDDYIEEEPEQIEEIAEGSEEYNDLKKVGAWTISSESSTKPEPQEE